MRKILFAVLGVFLANGAFAGNCTPVPGICYASNQNLTPDGVIGTESRKCYYCGGSTQLIEGANYCNKGNIVALVNANGNINRLFKCTTNGFLGSYKWEEMGRPGDCTGRTLNGPHLYSYYRSNRGGLTLPSSTGLSGIIGITDVCVAYKCADGYKPNERNTECLAEGTSGGTSGQKCDITYNSQTKDFFGTNSHTSFPIHNTDYPRETWLDGPNGNEIRWPITADRCPGGKLNLYQKIAGNTPSADTCDAEVWDNAGWKNGQHCAGTINTDFSCKSDGSQVAAYTCSCWSNDRKTKAAENLAALGYKKCGSASVGGAIKAGDTICVNDTGAAPTWIGPHKTLTSISQERANHYNGAGKRFLVSLGACANPVNPTQRCKLCGEVDTNTDEILERFDNNGTMYCKVLTTSASGTAYDMSRCQNASSPVVTYKICGTNVDYSGQSNMELYHGGNCYRCQGTLEWKNGACAEKPKGDIENVRRLVGNIRALDDPSGWKMADGTFNWLRLGADAAGATILGAGAGILTNSLIKNAQIKSGYESVQCIFNSGTATYGETFMVR